MRVTEKSGGGSNPTSQNGPPHTEHEEKNNEVLGKREKPTASWREKRDGRPYTRKTRVKQVLCAWGVGGGGGC